MNALCREYVRAVLTIGMLMGGAVLAAEIPMAADGFRWAIGALDGLMTASRWGTTVGTVLVLAAVLTALERMERLVSNRDARECRGEETR